MKKFLREHWLLAGLLVACGWLIHIALEAIIVNTLAAFAGIRIPTLKMA